MGTHQFNSKLTTGESGAPLVLHSPEWLCHFMTASPREQGGTTRSAKAPGPLANNVSAA